MLKNTKKKKLIFFVILVIVSFLILGYVGAENVENHEFSAERIVEHIEVLTSDEFEGRMIGTVGNEKTVEYIANHFKNVGLEPHIEKNYLTTFSAIKPVLDKPVVFNVVNKEGNIVREYTQGKDFLVRYDDFALGGDFSGNIHFVTSEEDLNSVDDMFEGLAVLIDFSDESIVPSNLTPSTAKRRLRRENAEVILYRTSDNLNDRNIWLGRKNEIRTTTGPIILGVNDQTYHELTQFYNLGYTVEIDSNLTFVDIEANNVLGVLPTANTSYEN